MSCQKCEERQNENLVAYYRWKNANVAMVGCDEHLREIFDVLNEAQTADAIKKAQNERYEK